LMDGGEVDTEDLLAAQMAARASDKGITYVAFTATPKAKTLQLFGRPGSDGKPVAFHVYSMRQAIEEGFILDVRKNYTPYKLAFDTYSREQGYALGTLVAFSGEVNDLESGAEPFTETSATLNPGLKGRDIRDAFNTTDFHLLLVANKFQTGFDQPLLCGMYV